MCRTGVQNEKHASQYEDTKVSGGANRLNRASRSLHPRILGKVNSVGLCSYVGFNPDSTQKHGIHRQGEPMEIMNQPFTGQLGQRLIELLDSGSYHSLNVVVAFAKNSGVLRIKDALQRFREQGGTVNVYVGVDLGGTSYEALTALLRHTDSLSVVHSERGQTFHPKIYQFLGEEEGLVVVGSHNLTGGGLWTNFESSVLVPVNNCNIDDVRLFEELGDYIRKLTGLNGSYMPIGEQDDINRLLENGYISKEVTEQIRLAKANPSNGGRERLFGNGVRAGLPRIGPNANRPVTVPVPLAGSSTVAQSDYGQTIWFETKEMTGGSRNILDLSMKSWIEFGDPTGTPFDLGQPTLMRGAVEFFGLNPTANDQTKDITLNFEGVDYLGNAILFPVGEKANGSWRLQIKGTSPVGQKITDAFKSKGEEYYLVRKVVTFTKIQVDYYCMSVFPESHLEEFRSASLILARNGSTKNARQLGLLQAT